MIKLHHFQVLNLNLGKKGDPICIPQAFGYPLLDVHFVGPPIVPSERNARKLQVYEPFLLNKIFCKGDFVNIKFPTTTFLRMIEDKVQVSYNELGCRQPDLVMLEGIPALLLEPMMRASIEEASPPISFYRPMQDRGLNNMITVRNSIYRDILVPE